MYSLSFAANSFMSALAPTLANSAIIFAFFFISSFMAGSVTSFFFTFFFAAFVLVSFPTELFFLAFTFLLLPSLDDELDDEYEEDEEEEELRVRLFFLGAAFDFLAAAPAATTAVTSADVESGTIGSSFFLSIEALASLPPPPPGDPLPPSLLDLLLSFCGIGRLADSSSRSRLRPRDRERPRDLDRRPLSLGDRDLLSRSREDLGGFADVLSKKSLTAWS